MSKFVVASYTDTKEEKCYYITFSEECPDSAIYISEELNIPLEKYIEICKNNNSFKHEEITDFEDCFKSIFQAQNALQEALEFSIEYNKDKQCNCDCEEDLLNILPKYPEDFSKNGGDITDNEINEHIKECIITLEEDNEKESISITDGNTMVIVDKYRACEDPECEGYNECCYSITVCKDVCECSIEISD